MSELPTDIWREIMIREDVEDLLRFRCVCKTFRDIIDCPIFHGQHLSHSSLSFTPQKLILTSRYNCYALNFDDIAPNQDFIRARVVNIRTPVSTRREIRCAPHSNGGLALFSDDDRGNVFAWNQSTRRHQNLPVRDLLYGLDLVGVNYGMGFDEQSRDCKVVLIGHLRGEPVPSVFVYKLRTCRDHHLRPSDWKPMKTLGYDILDKKSVGVFVGGALHWIARLDEAGNIEKFKKLVLAFDLATEEYRVMTLPHTWNISFHMVQLCVLGGCLCVTWRSIYSGTFEAWVMKEYGVVDSWSKLYALKDKDLIGIPYSLDVRPVAYSKCGSQVLFRFNDGLAWYHLKKKTVKHITLFGWRGVRSFTTTAYTGSFVPMDCNTLEIEIPSNVQRKRKL